MDAGAWGSGGTVQQDQGNRQRSTTSKLLRCFGCVVAAILVFLVASTVGRVTDFGSRGPEATAVGTAMVRECTEFGPVSMHGFGTTYACVADVRWDDGGTTRVEFPAGQLSPADKGHAVEVFRSPGRWGVASGYGRNDHATWYVVGLTVTILGFFAAAMLMFVAFGYALAVFRGGQSGSRRRRVADDWPVTDTDKAVVPQQRMARRVKLLAQVCLAAIVLQLLSSVPRNDAPRAVRFVSPWPQIEQAWLFRPLDLGVFVVGMALAVLLWSMAKVAEVDAARLVRYGEAFLTRSSPGKRKKVRAELKRLESGRRSALIRSGLLGGAVLGLAAYSAVRAVGSLPPHPPLLVAIATLRDPMVLGAVGIILLATMEAKYDRLRKLLELHHSRRPEFEGTGTGLIQS